MTNRRVAVLAAALAIGAAGCSSTPSDENASSPQMGHIHALQINPADQNLYAATHNGVFLVSDSDDPRLVGDLVQDFMGFAVAGPDHFLASGHPAADHPGQPVDLGLIESTDAGQSWNTLSLSGQADFHALDYRHGRVYGLDSHTGQILITDDKQAWQARPPVEAFDLAVSPNNPDEFLITTADGLHRSSDGGTTYEPVTAAPALVYLSWPDTGPMIGVDASGSLYASEDAGVTWQARHGLAERPHAVLAVGDGRVFVATDTAIYRSTDNADTVSELADVH